MASEEDFQKASEEDLQKVSEEDLQKASEEDIQKVSEEDFNKAAAIIEGLVRADKPNNEEKLKAYGFFKQGSGNDYATATAPGTFDFKGKAKYRAWGDVKDIPVDDAKKQYIDLANALKEKYEK
ncbi:acyl CoA binding protein-domain-containing protein [Talaromyces proteolyticus]|uniref:Acyl CoA binding protein-domain-containing protein n=1 Tax=Talaromyces proteolyticus TaxID=1131652 RepID=A0AAD4KFS4_9EURO|nr:acyl CoA binding protein-domain-containing protein [Talaromyces proteolyticus]KAH8691318.1 acyl CoA binding protein-domain-containing protein [Talaromyces proteolyticus]